jgi:hypothetical protein
MTEAIVVVVLPPPTTSAVDGEAVGVPSVLETEYDGNPAAPVELLESVGCRELLL